MESTPCGDDDKASAVLLDEDAIRESRLESQCTVDPGSLLDSLPGELLSLVIEYGYFSQGRAPDAAFRTDFMLTSHRLRDVALQTPSVWSIVQLKGLKGTQELPNLATYLKRSKEYPLDIYLDVAHWGREMSEDIMHYLLPHSGRWRRISISFMDEYILSHIHGTPLPILESLDISFLRIVGRTLSAPIFETRPQHLTHLCLRNIAVGEAEISFEGLKFLELRGYWTVSDFARSVKMLENATLLERLILSIPSEITFNQYYDAVEDPKISLPELRYLELFTSEWLSDHSVNLIRIFSLPKLHSLTMREDYNSSAQKSRIVMSYITEFHPLHSPAFYQPVEETTFSDPCKRLFIRDDPLQGNSTLDAALGILSPQMIEGTESLAVDYSPSSTISRRYSQEFLLAIPLPSLTSVSFRTISLLRWMHITEYFASNSNRYPRLTSLEILGATEVFPPNSNDRNYGDLAKGFPHLRRLTLDGVSANAFVRQLFPSSSLPPSDSSARLQAVMYPFPDFEVLSICNDANVSKPLLYRMISSRQEMGKPLTKLFLDRHFSENKDAWKYVKELVDVCEL